MTQSMNGAGKSLPCDSCTSPSIIEVKEIAHGSNSRPTQNERNKNCCCEDTLSPGCHSNSPEDNTNTLDVTIRLTNGPSTSKFCYEKRVNGDSEKCIVNGNADYDDSSSGNEAEEDSCFYMYKGNLQADLPSSFHKLERLAKGLDSSGDDGNERANNHPSRSCSSPDNEFLEMDFDPGPSVDQDSDDECLPSERVEPCLERHEDADLPGGGQSENDLSSRTSPPPESEGFPRNVGERLPPADLALTPTPTTCNNNLHSPNQPYYPLPQRGLHCISTFDSGVCHSDTWCHHKNSGDLISPLMVSSTGETPPSECADFKPFSWVIRNDDADDQRKKNLFSDLYHSIMAKRLVMEKNAGLADESNIACDETIDRVMIWSEQEACAKQITQISTSACGATAILNVLQALNILPPTADNLPPALMPRLRVGDGAPLPAYLFSRAVAGATHEDILRGIAAVSGGQLYGKFFHMWPARAVCLTRWLGWWMRRGAVPIVTLNLQIPRGYGGTNGCANNNAIADAWHHQMVFGVSSRGVYLTNPLECVPEAALWPQLASPSVLKIKRSDILIRWMNTTDLRPLRDHTDVRWKKMNVLGQVVSMVREWSLSSNSLVPSSSQVSAQYVDIPAAYSSGVTLIIPKDSPGCEELKNHPELPIFDSSASNK